jgi:LPS export ABC transporter permease LptF
MLYRRTLTREMGLTTGAVLTVLVAIALVVLFIRMLGDVARGELANEAVFVFLGFSLLYFLPVLMTIGLFAGVLLPLTRMWRDSEMVIWFNSGLSLTQWMRPVLTFALPFSLVILLLTLVINPWVQTKRSEYSQEMRSRAESALITPGLFAESSAGQRVYYVESLNPLTGVVRNVFMRSMIDGQLGLVVAREGSHTELADGSRYLVFKDGRRYEGTPGQLDYRIVQFERYWMRLDPVAAAPGRPTSARCRWRSCWQRSLAAGTRPAAVADRGAAFRADSLGDGDPAQLRQHAGAPLLRPGDRAAAVFRLQQHAVAVAGMGGAGEAESLGRHAVLASADAGRRGRPVLPALAAIFARAGGEHESAGALSGGAGAGGVGIRAAGAAGAVRVLRRDAGTRQPGPQQLRLGQASVVVLLSLPGHLYEILPVAALIGTLFALSRLVGNSEYAVMRVSGLSNWRVAGYFAVIGVVLSLLLLVLGEYVAPWSEQAAQRYKLSATRSVVAQQFRSGLWVKDGSTFINVREVMPDNTLRGIEIYGFDADGQLGWIRAAERPAGAAARPGTCSR